MKLERCPQYIAPQYVAKTPIILKIVCNFFRWIATNKVGTERNR